MSKELRELLNQLENMKGEVRSLLGQDKTEDAEKRMSDVRSLQKKIDVQRSLEEEETRNNGTGTVIDNNTGAPESREDAELEKEYRDVFMKGIRRQSVSSDERSIIAEYEKRSVMHGGGATGQTDGDSSLIVPQDIQTMIHQVTRQFLDLTQYVNVENVTALSGSRVIEVDAEFTPFPVIGEYEEIQQTDNPKFRPLSYAVKKRGGILPITNELIADSDQNVMNYISNWLGKKSIATRNGLILSQVGTLSKVAFSNLAEINSTLNVTLDPNILLSSIILTNQDGYNWLDNQVDGRGLPILQNDFTQPGRKLYKGRPVVVVNNRQLKTAAENKAPFIVGDLKQLITLFSRKNFELASTNEGGDAFKRDTTDLRGLMRDDIKTWDDKAAVYGQLDLSTEEVPEV